MKLRRLLSVVLAVVLVASCVVVAGSFAVTGADVDEASTSAYSEMLSQITAENHYGLSETVNDGTILQAWNWSFKNIENNLETLAKQGFTTIQVSPPNEIKTGTKDAKVLQSDNLNGWWMFYQPAGFQLNNSTDNALGTKDEFVSMCAKAKEYGVKIIVDAVINHMGTKEGDDTNTSEDPMTHVTPRAQTFEPEIYNNKLFHSPWIKMTYKEDPNQFSQYDSTYDLTRNCTSGLPDLKTEDQRVQNAIYDYMDELITAGADGFRFDAAKHIETPDDISGLASDFWTDTLGKVRKNHPESEVYAYGEILNNCGVNRPFSMYTKLFDVTDSGSYWGIKDAAVNGGGNAIPYYPNTNFTSANTILWDESHDTYMDGATTSLNTTQRGKIWALCAGRANITTVYFARPDDGTNTGACYNIKLGEAKKTSWSNATTKAINQFHNYFIGQSEYCTSANGWAYIERGSEGCMIVHLGGSTSGSFNQANHKLKNGSYKDSITGNVFTVSGGRIKGNVGNTGVACIYYDGEPGPDPTEDPNKPTTPPDPDGYPVRDGCYTVVFSNSQGWDGSINLYYWDSNTNSGPVVWPGEAMDFYETNEFGQAQYIGFVPMEYDMIIINNGTLQTVDVPFSGHTGLWADTVDGEGHYTVGTWEITVQGTDPGPSPTDGPTDSPLPTNPPPTPGDKLLGDADGSGKVNIYDASHIQKGLAGMKGFPDYQTLTSGDDFTIADVDKSGVVNIFDASLIQKYLAGEDKAQTYGIEQPIA